MAKAAPQLKRADRTRAAILEAAEAVFAERGFTGARLEAVAAQVGIRRPSLTYHFPTKAALYASVHAELVEDLRSAYARALIPPGSPVARVERLLACWVEFCFERPALLRLIMRELSGDTAFPPGHFARLVRPVIEPVREVIRAGVRAGVFRDVDPTAFVFSLGGATVFRVLGAPALALEEYPAGFERAHVQQLHGDLVRLARAQLGIHSTRPFGRREDAPR